MKNTIVRNGLSAKQNFQIRCSHCSSTLVVRNGTYPRNDPQTDEEIRIQRYLCRSPDCPWKSFSVLPKPILPIIRHTYETLFFCYAMLKSGMNQAALAWRLNVKRGVAKRLGSLCHRFVAWFNREKSIANWGLGPPDFWPDFTRDFSQFFFPERWIKLPSTQHIPLY